MNSRDQHLVALLGLIVLVAFVVLGTRQMGRYKAVVKESPYSEIAKRLNLHRRREVCDQSSARKRLYSSAVVDRFRPQIQQLWRERAAGGGQPKFSLVDLGAVKLRVNPKTPPATGFDSTSWSWEEAYFLIQKTQSDPNHPDTLERWRSVDTTVRFLLEKDYSRQVYGRKFPAPELAEHRFRPNPSVQRTGPREFTVALVPGAFQSHVHVLKRLMEEEWRGDGYRVLIKWVESGAYLVKAHSSSDRSFVDHRSKTLEIASLAWTKTVAHELGHVLGFDDHYYNVWNGRNCYYSQQSRLGDLMSNSERGSVTLRHWEILDKAYPWQAAGAQAPFVYVYGK